MFREKTKAEKRKDKIDCHFNIKNFNRGKRVTEEAGGVNRGKKPPKNTTSPPTSSSGGTIYLNFWGKEIAGTMWNVYGNFTVGHSGFTAEEIGNIKSRISTHYAPFNVVVTT